MKHCYGVQKKVRQILIRQANKHVCMHLIYLSSKLRSNTYRSVAEMASIHEMQRVDRELHLELAESPVNPAFTGMFSSIPDGCDPLF